MGQSDAGGNRDGLKPILSYISNGWDTLTRSMTECQSVVDPKIKAVPVLYLPAGFAEPEGVKKLSADCNVKVEPLPVEIHQLGQITANVEPSGLLYLPNKYVVPGGRFNEMYGWDSYFIIRGLLLAGKVELARDMVDNFFFEIEHYGAMLNANRTYYLTRSQPPFLSSAFVDVYQATPHDKPDTAWLERAYADLQKDYEMWMHDPHRAGDTGLSRYYDFGDGPPAEAIKDESGIYRKVAEYFSFILPRRMITSGLAAGSGQGRSGCGVYASGVRLGDHDGASGVRQGASVHVEFRLLQGRPVDARVGVRCEFTLWSVWIGNAPLCAGLP